ncbi:hypothetical protein HDU86_007660 [Geranomyces michiganensis]|nr:hypothetical protein HDU86_007660 [Geranomyces michiganensis]
MLVWKAAALLALSCVRNALSTPVATPTSIIGIPGTAYYNTSFPQFFENPDPTPGRSAEEKRRFLGSLRSASRKPNFDSNFNDDHDAQSTFVSGNWAGINHFYLAPLYAKSPDDLKYTLDKIKAAGFKVIRTFIQAQYYNCAKTDQVSKLPDIEGPLGKFNPDVMAIYEKVFEEIAKRGMKVIIAIRNGNNFGFSPCDVYCQAAGGVLGREGNSADFPMAELYYSSSKFTKVIDQRIDYVMNYKMRAFNQTLGQLDKLVLAFETENEPFVQVADKSPLVEDGRWLCDRARRIQNGIRGANILVTTGAIGGSWEHGNMRDSVLNCDAIDVISIHGYFDKPSTRTDKWENLLVPLVAKAKAADKLILVEEWYSRYPSLDDQGVAIKSADMRIQSLSMARAGVPSIYWDAMKRPEGTLCDGTSWSREGDDISVDGPWWSVVADLVSWVGQHGLSQESWASVLNLPAAENHPLKNSDIPSSWRSKYWLARMKNDPPAVTIPPVPSHTSTPTGTKPINLPDTTATLAPTPGPVTPPPTLASV